MKRSPQFILGTAIFCLLISGAAGLVYQVVWMRYLSLFLGSTSHAIVAVLVAFMGGLALGNAWLGAKADRVRRPLALYGWLEIGIAAYALVFPHYYDFCHDAYISLARHLTPGSAPALGLKFTFSLLTILVPTVLMGGTLPVMIRLVTRSLGELRERVSTLYFVNSVGAVLGCFLADFWWIPTIGLPYTVLAGAAMNLLVGAVALSVSRWSDEDSTIPGGVAVPVGKVPEETFSPAELRLAIVGIGVSGFVAMLYEVVWTRMLALALGSSHHAFSLMLMTFISGIAVGAWIVGRWRNLRRTMDAFGWAELALAATLPVSMFFYDLIPFWFVKLAELLARRTEAYPFYQLIQALICFGVMFVPTVCLGMTLPLVSRIATAEVARTGRSVGAVFSVNTLGTVLGAVATGLWLMPWLGLARTLALGIGLNAAVGLVVLGRNHHVFRRLFIVGAPVGTALLVLFAGERFDDSWRRLFSMGLWRTTAPSSVASYRAYGDSLKFAYHRDGAGSTVCVTTEERAERTNLVLRVNGKPDASTIVDLPTQLLMGHVPMLLSQNSREVLVVGLGSGMTGGAVMRHPGVERLDVVEISPEVARAARLFGPYNDQVLENPRVHLTLDDAKSFLRSTDRKYDVIISEPSNPWMAGVSGVFSREYYENCRNRLQPGGVMAQWVQSYETDDAVLEIVLGTFASVFPLVSVWEGTSSDLILIGSTQPLPVDFKVMRQRFSVPSVKSDFERMDIFTLPVLLGREIVSAANTPYIVRPGTRLNGDYHPVLEQAAQRAFFVRGDASSYDRFNENWSTRSLTLLGRYLQSHSLSEDDFKAFALFQSLHGVPTEPLFRTLLERWQHDFPDATVPLELSAKSGGLASGDEAEVTRMGRVREKLLREASKEPEALRLYSRALLRTYWSKRSIFHRPSASELKAVLARLVETDGANQRVHKLHLAELSWDEGDDVECFKFAQSAFDPDTNTSGPIRFELDREAPSRVLTRMIESLWRAGEIGDALNLCRQATMQGFAGRSDGMASPVLDMTCRKVIAASVPSAAPGGN